MDEFVPRVGDTFLAVERRNGHPATTHSPFECTACDGATVHALDVRANVRIFPHCEWRFAAAPAASERGGV